MESSGSAAARSPQAAQGESRRNRVAGILLAGLGAFAALATVGGLAAATGQAWVLGSFGASCVLLFGFPDGPFSKPRNVIGGHVLASAVGLVFLHALGPGWLPMAAAAACATMLMMATGTVHPPAGSNPVIVFLAQPGWDFIVLPTLAGACALMLLGRLYWRLARSLHARS
ncbi:HPP family protein [Pseudoxanthomonas putridarboris]|uniref:HPP family protein n=1 Tax=Pseudoxanthomonas putridarboris TaxID=752605 RepID=A0ABU9J4P1_9GAMM